MPVRVLPKPLLWFAGILLVVLIGLSVRSPGRPPAVEAPGPQASPAALPAAAPLPAGAAAPAMPRQAAPAHSFGSPAPPSPAGVATRPAPSAVLPPPNAPSISLQGVSLPGASPSIAGITVTGIAGGRVRVAVVEVDGRSTIVGVGDRIRDFTVKAISENEVVLEQGARTFRLSLARGGSAPTMAGGAPPAAIPAAAPAAAPAGTPLVAPPVATIEPAPTSTPPQPPTTLVASADVRPAGYPAQTAVPLAAVPLTAAPPIPPVTPPGATLYTPSNTAVYGFATAPVTPQSEVTVRGVTALPVASNDVRPGGQVLPPAAAAVLYTPSDTSVYGVMAPPATTQNEVTLRGATGLPVASNQAPSVTQVLPRPLYQIEVGPFADQQSATTIAERLASAGFRASVAATPAGQYTVTLTPPPQSTVGDGLLVVRSVGADLPIKLQLGP